MWDSQIAYQTEQLLQKNFLDTIFSLESDKMTALWPNDSLTVTCMWLSQKAYQTEQLL